MLYLLPCSQSREYLGATWRNIKYKISDSTYTVLLQVAHASFTGSGVGSGLGAKIGAGPVVGLYQNCP